MVPTFRAWEYTLEGSFLRKPCRKVWKTTGGVSQKLGPLQQHPCSSSSIPAAPAASLLLEHGVMSAAKTSVVSAAKTSLVSAAKTSPVSAAKTSAVSAAKTSLVSQDISMIKTTTRARLCCARVAVGGIEMSWDPRGVLAADTADVLAADTRDVLAADTTDVLAADNKEAPVSGKDDDLGET